MPCRILFNRKNYQDNPIYPQWVVFIWNKIAGWKIWKSINFGRILKNHKIFGQNLKSHQFFGRKLISRHFLAQNCGKSSFFIPNFEVLYGFLLHYFLYLRVMPCRILLNRKNYQDNPGWNSLINKEITLTSALIVILNRVKVNSTQIYFRFRSQWAKIFKKVQTKKLVKLNT